MRLRLLCVFAALGAIACASGGQGGDSSGATGDEITLVVINEYTGTVTAYAIWGGNRIRLGDVGSNRTRTFSTPLRSDRIAVGLQAIGAPPAGTSGGPTRFGAPAGTDPDPSAPYVESEAVPVVAGDAIEFRLSAAARLLYLRLPSR